jgi:hypothetical protein
MARVAIRTGITGADGQEVVLREFVCDWPDCPSIAEHTVAVVRELRASLVVCGEHAAILHKRGSETV